MPNSSRKAGILYVVATPIGNLADLTFRAVETLRTVDLVAAEDTRLSSRLLAHYSITTARVPYHEHNEREQSRLLVRQLLDGKNVALITDAGTPLLSDPGYRLVCAAHDEQITVVPVPGCCAAIAALSVSGLPTDRFVFEGFLPARKAARRSRLERLADEPRTLLIYESAHRIRETLSDLVEIFGGSRMATLARELTKQYETLIRGEISNVYRRVVEDDNQVKGEFVLCINGYSQPQSDTDESVLTVLVPLLKALPMKQAVALATEISGKPRNLVYKTALACKK